MDAEHPEASPDCQEAGDRDEDRRRDAQDENRDEPPDRRRGRDEFEDLHQPQRSKHVPSGRATVAARPMAVAADALDAPGGSVAFSP